MPKIGEFFTKIILFVTHDIWRLNISVLSKRKAFWIRQLKVLLITFREFNNGKGNVQASALSFYLLLSIVPIVAIVFAVSSGFGIEEYLKNWLTETFPDQQEVVNKLLLFAESAIENARGGWITGVGIAVLLWSSLSMFVRIEEALNAIWQAKRHRAWARRFSDYLSIMLIAPVLLILSNSMTVTFRFYLDSATEQIPLLGTLKPVIFTLLPLILIWIIFTLLFVVMPNVKVRIPPALIAAIVSGTAFYLVEQVYIYSQVSISKYNAIYGSLAAIPLFLFCAKLGWQIVLFGAELSFAYQNLESYEDEIMEKEHLSHHNFTVLSIYVLKNIVDVFKSGSPPKLVSKLSDELGLSIRSLNVIIEALLKCGLILEVNTAHKDDAYVPALDINRITLKLVLRKLENLGGNITMEKTHTDVEKISALVEKIYDHADKEEVELKIAEL
ncbi:MAG: YihY/virulence factor BrkB family protein [Prevotellaceae bacterium]|jgi:membrane protein|nr:YihY/virulence factor BrkB family protein [Prevotellaceae bacterium]